MRWLGIPVGVTPQADMLRQHCKIARPAQSHKALILKEEPVHVLDMLKRLEKERELEDWHAFRCIVELPRAMAHGRILPQLCLAHGGRLRRALVTPRASIQETDLVLEERGEVSMLAIQVPAPPVSAATRILLGVNEAHHKPLAFGVQGRIARALLEELVKPATIDVAGSGHCLRQLPRDRLLCSLELPPQEAAVLLDRTRGIQLLAARGVVAPSDASVICACLGPTAAEHSPLCGARATKGPPLRGRMNDRTNSAGAQRELQRPQRKREHAVLRKSARHRVSQHDYKLQGHPAGARKRKQLVQRLVPM